MINIKKSQLESGITVVTEGIEGVRSISLGFWVVVGSRNENKQEKGISHFIEHTLFKGTKKRNAKEIARALESKGATLDAFTSKEITCFYSRGLDTHLKIATDVIADLITNPLFPEEELKKEIGVVTEEIKDSEDSPERHIFDLLFKKIFTKHPLANSVLGEKKDVEKITRKKVSSFFKKWYNPERIVVTASGYLQHNELLGYLEPYFKPKETSNDSFFTPVKNYYKPFSYTFKKKGLFQAHLILATTVFDYNDPRRYPLLVLDTILGDGMSSILFQKVREEKALVYQIFSFADFFSDAGIFGVYLACNPVKIENAKSTVIKEFKKLVKKGLTKKVVSEAKVRLKAKLLIGQESTSNRMMRLGRSEIYRRENRTIDEIIASINRVKTGDVNDVIKDVLREDKFSFVYFGDFRSV
ncbi:MAG: insulinase family protein [Candidatus Cloacimonadota bacterium]|nr:MAG: insulinase family protein [Candidatus Cloacimonadota bacterium]